MIVVSAPCLPKSTYHCGNAISAIYAELIANYFKVFRDEKKQIIIPTPWNLHGKPFEEMYYLDYHKHGSYDEILAYAMERLGDAENEIKTFINDPTKYERHCDTDRDFVEYTKDRFIKLIKDGYIIKVNGNWMFDTNKVISGNELCTMLSEIHVIPNYDKATIIKQSKTFNGLYPLSKDREFTVKASYSGEEISINPIFQSFIFPNYLLDVYGEDKISYFVSGRGFSMHKWHYYRQLVSIALEGSCSISNIALHGTIMGNDFQIMSKHSDNCIQPSDLSDDPTDILFVRYVLIRSISVNDIPIYLEKYKKEYERIKEKLLIIQRKREFGCDKTNENILKQIEELLYKNKYSAALEMFYVYLKKLKIYEDVDQSICKTITKIYKVFFGDLNYAE